MDGATTIDNWAIIAAVVTILGLLVVNSVRRTIIDRQKELIDDQMAVINDRAAVSDLSMLSREALDGLRMEMGVSQFMPDAVGDAKLILFVMDRSPENGADRIDCDRPVIWIDAESQSSYRWNDADESWEDTTQRHNGTHLLNLTAFTTDDVFVYAHAEIHLGAHRRLMQITGADLTTEQGQGLANSSVALMTRSICEHMDMAAGDDTWTRIWDANRAGNLMSVEYREPPSSRPLQPVAPPRDNPFEDHRRPIVIDDADNSA